MSSIHTYPSQVEEFTNHASERNAKNQHDRAAVDAGADHHDESMMFPWSIGTTTAAKERPVARRKEECPPETYIG